MKKEGGQLTVSPTLAFEAFLLESFQGYLWS